MVSVFGVWFEEFPHWRPHDISASLHIHSLRSNRISDPTYFTIPGLEHAAHCSLSFHVIYSFLLEGSSTKYPID
jgi:hypothetical protein